jgi:hypothetical protein
LQAQKRRSNWVALLPELALVINTTSTRALLQNKTPFEVWFGRKPRWITAKPLEPLGDDVDDSDGIGVEDDTNNKLGDNEDPVLTKIEARVVANNARLHAQMIKANSCRNELFLDGTIATLRIPLKLRLATEPSRLPVRILKYKNGQYKLQCRHGRLAGRYQGGELNSIDPSISDLLGNNIRTKPEEKAGKEVTIKFPSAVAKENSRGTITSAQKAGRTTKSHAKPGPKPRQKPGPKPGRKHKQTEVITIDDNAGDDDASEPAPVPKPRAKPGPKPGAKRKRAEVETIDGDGGEPISPRKLRKRAEVEAIHGDGGQPTSPRKLRKRA